MCSICLDFHSVPHGQSVLISKHLKLCSIDNAEKEDIWKRQNFSRKPMEEFILFAKVTEINRKHVQLDVIVD